MTSPALPKALIVYNPNASTADAQVRDRVAARLRTQWDIKIAPTKQRGHASHLAAGAVHERYDAVFALGGDGTVNEVIQGLAESPVALGHIPGGSTNVFARCLGLENNPDKAVEQMIASARTDGGRQISLGMAGQRWFGFNAGIGFDAELCRTVEQHPGLKRRLGQRAFVMLGMREWFRGEARGNAKLAVGGMDGHGATGTEFNMVTIANTGPYTFLGKRPMYLHPKSSFERGLDVLGMRPANDARITYLLLRCFAKADHVASPVVEYWHDLKGLTVSSPEPQAMQVDGDYAGMHRTMTFRSVPNALRVFAPPARPADADVK